MRQIRDGEQNLFNLFGLFSILFLTSTLFGGSFENFKRVQSESFSHYIEQNDVAFAAYLQKEWSGYRAYVTPPLYQKPKPKDIPSLREKHARAVGPLIQLKVPQNKPIKKPSLKAPSAETNSIRVDFFGLKLSFKRDKTLSNIKYFPQNHRAIANAFKAFSASSYTATLTTLKAYKEAYRLNDWALYLLVSKLAKQIYTQRDDANLYIWFLLNKLHYDVKIASNEKNSLFVLLASKERLYQKARYLIGTNYYYLLENIHDTKSIENLYSYANSYTSDAKAIEFSLQKLPLFAEATDSKELLFTEGAKKYTFHYRYNKNLIDFMATYPQVDYAVYFKAPMQEQTYQDLAEQFKLYLDGKKMAQGLNFVLHFVQKAFIYKRDREQFGAEKIMFAEETLVYDASDCEDRAILFAYLVKHIFGVSVVGVKYSDHMSTALFVPLKGASVRVGKRAYLLADPTYINANIGQEMPKYRDIEPEAFIYF